MRKLLCIPLALGALCLLPAGANAGALAFTATLGVAIANLPPITLEGSGTALVSGPGTSIEGLEFPAGVFGETFSVPVSDPTAFPVAGILTTVSNGAGSFSGILLGGPMALPGQAKICLFSACDESPLANVVVPFTANGTSGVGLGGSVQAAGLVNVTVTGGPWTVGKVTSGAAELEGFIHGPNGGDASTAGAPGGQVQLVTPITIQTDIGGATLLPAFGILTLTFVPEPGTLLLVAAGVTALGVVGRSRGRR